MDLSFTSVGIAGLGVAGVAARMIWMARKAAPPVAACCADEPGEGMPAALVEPRQPWYKKLLAAIDYLRTGREWRYRTPWIMLLGEPGAGKSSLIASIPAEHRQAGGWHDAQVGVAPEQWQAQWHFLQQGVLIDVDGALPRAAPGSVDAKKWERVLAKIDELRPERALDGLVLTVSAATLLGKPSDTRLALAQDLYRQMSDIQDRFEFALPVYVVVTQSDAVPGFAEFWRTQPERRHEMFGWSFGPHTQSETPEEWADQVFDGLGTRLKEVQIAVAAEKEEIADVDPFFLFPRHFQQLRTPLKHWMSIVFQTNGWRAGFLCRGVYFTGWVEGKPPRPEEPCQEVSFVEHMVTEKVLAEPHLARPTRQGILSRNRLIRTVQLAGLLLFAGWTVLFAIQAYKFQNQLTILADSIEVVKTTNKVPESGEKCASRAAVYNLAAHISHIDSNLHYPTMPVSYLVPSSGGMGAHVIKDHALQQVILPALACRLNEKANELVDAGMPAPRAAANGKAGVVDDDDDDDAKAGAQAYGDDRRELLRRLDAIEQLQTNMDRFKRIASEAHHSDSERLLHDFIDLVEYAYDTPLPRDVRNERGALSAALVKVQYAASPSVPARLRATLETQLETLGTMVHAELSAETRAGETLLRQLAMPEQGPVAEDVRHFAGWLMWVRGAWLGSTKLKNPCQEIHDELGDRVNKLVRHDADLASLQKIPAHFSETACYTPLMDSLTRMRLPPEGQIFERKNGVLVINDRLLPEEQGIAALMALDFVQEQGNREFNCSATATGWRTAQLAQVANYMHEYQRFARGRGLPAAGPDSQKQPLYDKLARQQLLAVFNRAMNDAQAQPGAGSPLQSASLDPVALADQQMARTSADFAMAVDPLLGALRLYQQAGFAREIEPVENCAREFASANLGRIDRLVLSSRLYAPDTDGADGSFFALGPMPVTKDYLARQIARGQVLTGYASPFLAMLQNSEAGNDAHRPNTQSADYWNNSISELSRYTQAQEPNGQVAHLHGLFLKTFAGLNLDNCGKTLAAYQAPEPGNDLFSRRREELENRVRWRCSDRRHAQAYEAYYELAMRFDRELRGQYPFAPLSAPDAQPATVRSFFADYDVKRATLREMLDGLKGNRWDRVRGFLAQLDSASDFFKTNLGAGDSGQPVKLAVTFRALPDVSPGSDQIVQWAVTSGSSMIAHPNRTGPLDWYVGQPLVLDLTWANRSPWVPVNDRKQRDLQSNGGSASFSMAGEWALLRWIEARRARTTRVYEGGLDPAQLLLEFAVPIVHAQSPAGTAPGEWARVYLALRLSAKDPKTQAPVAIRLPAQFPQSAPKFPHYLN